MIVRFDNNAVKQQKQEPIVGVDNDPASLHENVSETDAILSRTEAQTKENGDVAGDVTPNATAEDADKDAKVNEREAEVKS